MKVALITGASRGIGQGLVHALSKAGHTVYAGTRDDRPGPKHANVIYLKLNVQSDQSIAEAVDQIQRQRGHLDLLINNAGIVAAPPHQRETVSRLSNINRHDMLQLFDVNTVSPLMIVKPTEAATKILPIIQHWKPPLNGKFLDNDGTIFDQ